MNTQSLTVYALVVVVSIFLLAQISASLETNATLPLKYAAKVLDGTDQLCPSEDIRDDSTHHIHEDIHTLLQELAVPKVETPCGDGWTRVAYLNMTDPMQECPLAWNEITSTKRVCGMKSGAASCDSVTYTTSRQYDRVCGRIIGYMYNGPDAFYEYTNNPSITIDSYYVDGVSVTHGQPREHIWTFAAGAGEENDASWICPCSNPTNTQTIVVPPFVGNNYFCESGLTVWTALSDTVYTDDPLWDGDGCGPSSNCCTFNSPPWFSVQLPTPTTDDIEVRLCDNTLGGHDDSPIEIIELYVL